MSPHPHPHPGEIRCPVSLACGSAHSQAACTAACSHLTVRPASLRILRTRSHSFPRCVPPETQLWTALQSQLASLSEIQSQAEASVSRAATLQSQWNDLDANDSDGDESASAESEERRNLGSALQEAYATLKSQTDEEMK